MNPKDFNNMAKMISNFAKELEKNLVNLDNNNVELFKDINTEATNKFQELKRELTDLEKRLSDKW